MNFPTGLGGITLIVIAVVWLLIFVPGWSKRSEVRELTVTIGRTAKAQQQPKVSNEEERLRRLIRTQRTFTFLSVVFALIATALVVTQATAPVFIGLAVFSALLSVLSFLVRRASSRALANLISHLNFKRQAARERAYKDLASNSDSSKVWTPNPLPAPLQLNRTGELLSPDADIIDIKIAQKNNFDTQDLNAILRRRRAI